MRKKIYEVFFYGVLLIILVLIKLNVFGNTYPKDMEKNYTKDYVENLQKEREAEIQNDFIPIE